MLRLLFTAGVILFGPSCLIGQARKNSLIKPAHGLGFRPTVFFRFGKRVVQAVPSLGACLVWFKDTPRCEGYFHGALATTVFGIKSVTQSIISALTGITRAEGPFPDLGTPVLSLFPKFAQPHSALTTVWLAAQKAQEDSIQARLCLNDLLTMQSGWACVYQCGRSGSLYHGPSVCQLPGSRFNYCSAYIWFIR